MDIRKEDVELDSHVKEDASGRRYLKVPGSEFIFRCEFLDCILINIQGVFFSLDSVRGL